MLITGDPSGPPFLLMRVNFPHHLFHQLFVSYPIHHHQGLGPITPKEYKVIISQPAFQRLDALAVPQPNAPYMPAADISISDPRGSWGMT
jgi:hypothetical protein